MKHVGPWKTISERQIYDNPWIQVEEHDVITPSGAPGIYGKVSFKNLAIGIIPLDEEQNTWLVGQHRYPLDTFSWEIPEGGGPAHETPLEAAHRELKEETGLTARKWKELMVVHTSNSVTDEKAIIYLATELEAGESSPEPTESDLVVKRVPFREALRMVLDQEITDSLSVSGILKTAFILGIR